MLDNNDEIEKINYDDEELKTPKNAKKTLKRLVLSIKDEYKRLLIVVISIIFYTILTIIAPLYSAKIIDLLWNSIQTAMQKRNTFFNYMGTRRNGNFYIACNIYCYSSFIHITKIYDDKLFRKIKLKTS